MNTEKIKTLLLAMASCNRMLMDETGRDGYWEAITDAFSTYLIMAGTGLEAAYRSDDDTDEFAAVELDSADLAK